MEDRIASVILAGGKGTRMGVPGKHKCVFEINGKPAIVLLLENLQAAGIETFVVVVGAYAEQIMATLGEHFDHVGYVYQAHQKGTGNAVKHAARFLKTTGFDGPVLITAGDAYIDPGAIRHLIEQYKENDSDLAFLVKEKESVPFAGRIFHDKDRGLVTSVEYWDIARARFVRDVSRLLEDENTALDEEELRARVYSMLLEEFKTANKARKIIPGLAALLEDGTSRENAGETRNFIEKLKDLLAGEPTTIQVKDQMLDPDVIENGATHVNISVYLCNGNLLYDFIEKITDDNAQKEEYLTDLIPLMSFAGKSVLPVPVPNDNDVMSFNTPEELEEINEHLSKGNRSGD